MCGIAGILKVWPADQRDRALQTPHVHAIPEAWLDILDDSIKHRGPDGRGRFRDRAVRADGCVVDVAFVHRRLSIIDHAGGHQPMLSLGKGQGVVTGVKRYALGEGLGLYDQDAASELLGAHSGTLGALSANEGHEPARSASERHQRARSASEGSSPSDRVCVIFNGCIYNHRELRAELQRAGHVFSTDHSDTEVLMHGWREWGENLPRRIDGMCAAAIWDAATTQVCLTRDLMGEKPLYLLPYALSENMAAFCSCPPGLARLHAQLQGGAGVNKHPFAYSDYFTYGFDAGHATMLDGVWKVEPSRPQVFSVVEGRLGLRHLSSEHGLFGQRQRAGWKANEPHTPTVTAESVDMFLRLAVQSRLDSDVAMGSFLSGGIDSALISLFAKDALGNLRTFTVQMPDCSYDESSQAERVSKIIGTDHSTLQCNAKPAEDLQAVLMTLGLPFADSSLLPTMWVSRAARSEVGVSLTGDGGDELFLGYDRYRAAQHLRRLGRLLSVLPAAKVFGQSGKSKKDKLGRLLHAARGGGYPQLLAIFQSQDFQTLTGRVPRKPWAPNAKSDPVAEAVYFDLLNYLPGDLLTKSDTASMSVALEVRTPMLTRSLIEAATNAPISSLMPHGQRKGLLRQVARKYLPAEIVDRPKMGFAIPIGEWFRSDYGGLRTMLLDHLNSSEPFGSPSLGIDLNMKFVRQMLDEHLGTGPSGRVVRDHSQRLYMLLVLSIWAKWLSGLQKDPAAAPN